MFNFFMVVGFICIPVLINYLCGKYISITMRFKLSGSDCVCRHHTISGFHHPKHLFCGIKRSSESSERAVEVMPISSLYPLLPREGGKNSLYGKACFLWRKNRQMEKVMFIQLCKRWQADFSVLSVTQHFLVWDAAKIQELVLWKMGYNMAPGMTIQSFVLPLVC